MVKTGYEVLGESLQAMIQNMKADGRILGAQVCVVIDSCRVVDIAAGGVQRHILIRIRSIGE